MLSQARLPFINDGADGVPANVAAMTERQLVIAYLDRSAAGTGGNTLMGGTLASTWTVNGTRQGSFCTVANECQHWRVLLADRSVSSVIPRRGARDLRGLDNIANTC